MMLLIYGIASYGVACLQGVADGFASEDVSEDFSGDLQ